MKISNCCGASVAYLDQDEETGICMDCKEHCGIEDSEEEIKYLSKEQYAKKFNISNPSLFNSVEEISKFANWFSYLND